MAVRPCLVAFLETTDLPSAVHGPVDDWALSWLAVICAAVDMLGSWVLNMGKAARGVGAFLVSNVAGGLGGEHGWVL